MKTVTAYTPIFRNEGRFDTGVLTTNEIEAKRSIGIFEGRDFIAIAKVTFEYEPDSQVSGMEYRADEKLAYRIPCRKEDGSYYTEDEMRAMQAEMGASRA